MHVNAWVGRFCNCSFTWCTCSQEGESGGCGNCGWIDWWNRWKREGAPNFVLHGKSNGFGDWSWKIGVPIFTRNRWRLLLKSQQRQPAIPIRWIPKVISLFSAIFMPTYSFACSAKILVVVCFGVLGLCSYSSAENCDLSNVLIWIEMIATRFISIPVDNCKQLLWLSSPILWNYMVVV